MQTDAGMSSIDDERPTDERPKIKIKLYDTRNERDDSRAILDFLTESSFILKKVDDVLAPPWEDKEHEVCHREWRIRPGKEEDLLQVLVSMKLYLDELFLIRKRFESMLNSNRKMEYYFGK